MNKIARRLGALLAVLLAAVIGLGAATPANAADYSHKVTFKGVATGDQVDAYQLMKYADKYNGYEFNADYKQFCITFSQSDGYTSLSQGASDEDLSNWLSGLSSEQTTALLKAYVNSWGSDDVISSVAKPSVWKSSGVVTSEARATIDFDTPGYYLVLPRTASGSVGSALYNPLSVFVKVDGNESTITLGSIQTPQSGDVEVQMKSATGPSIEKYTERANGDLRKTRTVSPGETVTFAVRIDFSSYGEGGGLKPVLHDMLTNVEMNESSSIKVCQATSDGKIGDEITADGILEPNYGDYKDGVQALDVSIDWDKISVGTQKSVFIVYTATVTDGIVAQADRDGNYVATNKAYLEYPTTLDGGQTSQTESSSVELYSYGLKITKNNDNGDALSGAKFTLSDTTAGGAQVYFKRIGDTYYVVEATESHDGTVTELEASAGARNNELDVRGLDCSHKYVLTESKAPNGYYNPSGTWEIEFVSMKQSGNSEEHTGNLKSARIEGSDNPTNELVSSYEARDATFSVVIMNTTTPSLPTTGGMGTVLFTVAGVALMVVAAAIFFMKRRHN